MKTKLHGKHLKKDIRESNVKINRTVEEELKRFLEIQPPGRLARNLRNLILDFLMYDGAAQTVYLRELLMDVRGLYELLDCIEREATNVKDE